MILRDWYQVRWDLASVSWSHNFFLSLLTFYSGKECLYLTATSGHFLAFRECLSSGRLRSSNKKFWSIEELQRIDTMQCTQSLMLTISNWDARKSQNDYNRARVVNIFFYFDIYICENLSFFSLNQISQTYVNDQSMSYINLLPN